MIYYGGVRRGGRVGLRRLPAKQLSVHKGAPWVRIPPSPFFYFPMKDQRKIKFIADNMLGKLAKWLRILGFNTSYPKYAKDVELVFISASEDRILLTRDTGIIKRKGLKNYLFIRSDFWKDQLIEVIEAFHLRDVLSEEKFFTICPICNEELKPIEKDEVIGRVPHYVFCTTNEFSVCPSCKKIYWKGTHIEKIKGILGYLSSKTSTPGSVPFSKNSSDAPPPVEI